MRKTQMEKDGWLKVKAQPTIKISINIPIHLMKKLKVEAGQVGCGYQSLIKYYIRRGLKIDIYK